MGLSSTPLPLDRVHLVNPGQTISVGDHRLTAFRPPVFDNPVTAGLLDDGTGALFSSDCFGALLAAVPENAVDLDLDELRSGLARWATIDSPWVHDVDRGAFSATLAGVRAIEPSLVCSSHLPPAPGSMLGVLVDALATTPECGISYDPSCELSGVLWAFQRVACFASNWTSEG
jgi:hypothetical protein